MIIYDIEKKEPMIEGIEPMIEGIEYFAGWNDYENMGISCICAYDYTDDRYRVFTESNKDEFKKLIENRKIYIGFNNINFDNKVIETCWGIKIQRENCYDILRKILAAVGLDENKFIPAYHEDYGLDACCRANFGLCKTEYGGYAPIDWQQGKIGDVIDYCLNDIKLTKMLFEKIRDTRVLLNPKTGQYMDIEYIK